MHKRIATLFWCVAVGLAAFVCLDFWSEHNAPLYKRLERQWAADVQQLEASKKLPGPWFDVQSLVVYGGTPETRDWLKLIHVPVKTKRDGHYQMEILVVAWEEDGKHGAMVQYDLVDLESKNNIWELGRTFILAKPKPSGAMAALWDELHR